MVPALFLCLEFPASLLRAAKQQEGEQGRATVADPGDDEQRREVALLQGG